MLTGPLPKETTKLQSGLVWWGGGMDTAAHAAEGATWGRWGRAGGPPRTCGPEHRALQGPHSASAGEPGASICSKEPDVDGVVLMLTCFHEENRQQSRTTQHCCDQRRTRLPGGCTTQPGVEWLPHLV